MLWRRRVSIQAILVHSMVVAAAPPRPLPSSEAGIDVANAHSAMLDRLESLANHESEDAACLLLQVSANRLVGRVFGGTLSSGELPAQPVRLQQDLAKRLAAYDVEEAQALPPSQLRLEFAERLEGLDAVAEEHEDTSIGDAIDEYHPMRAEPHGTTKARLDTSTQDEAPKKSKVALMVLEIIPPCGQLGLDRLYLGSTKTGIAKLIVCISTCLVGGLVWGFIDAFVVIMNCLGRDKSIDSLGMRATFTDDEVETAHALAVIGVAIQLMTCCITPSAFSCLRRLASAEKKPGPLAAGSQSSLAMPANALPSSSPETGGH
uniref:TM2 domain-containing protein n=1 Tax=Alexandrium catenella TaxID=2925 RepID=A0A7S1PRR8_ALECA|mmetsp:Transcript_10852/g.29544  ORF Transcript_10852/g.29544 Transcript_10852/m.29544 type:complete len:319 (+) Transcript_10852:97-1053(+)